MDALVKAYRDGTINMKKLRQLQINDSDTFDLEKSVGRRPNPIPTPLDVDVAFIRRIVRSLQRSTVAGKRFGHEWSPQSTNVSIKKREDDTSFAVEELEGLNGVCTKWCTRTFFPDSSTRLSFVFNVFRLYTVLSNQFSDLHFDIVFKGGVIMRLLILEFLESFPIHERVVVEKYLESERALSFSDFDFEIVPRNHTCRQDLTLRLFSLDFALLMWLRLQMDKLSMNKKENPLFDVSWDEAEEIDALKRALQDETDGYSSEHRLHGATIDHVVRGCYDRHPPKGYKTSSGNATPGRRHNVFIFTRRGDKEKSVMDACDYFEELDVPGVPCDDPHHFYATMNTFIGEGTPRERAEQLQSVFHLCRIKQGFVVYLTMKDGEKRCARLGGEVLDLSQSHGTKLDEMRRYLYSRVEQPYRQYYVIGTTFHIRSYSANGLFHDLRIQIHFQDTPPFESLSIGKSKIKKRLLRYLLFMVIYTLGPFVESAFDHKVKQLYKLLTTTSSIDQLYRSSRANIEPIDDFVSQERKTLRLPGALKKKQTYLAAIHRHLKMIQRLLMAGHRSKETMDERFLELADTFLY